MLHRKTNCNILQWKIQYFKRFLVCRILAYFILIYTHITSKSKNTCQYQPDKLDDNHEENNHKESSYPPKIKFMISGETL